MMPDPHLPNAVHAGTCAADIAWTTINAGENLPGVVAPITWSFYGDCTERAFRSAFRAVGVLRRSETAAPARPEDRVWDVFYGRVAANVTTMRAIADRTPGTSGSGLEQQLFGRVRPGVVDHPEPLRYPVVAVRMPVAMARIRRDLERSAGPILPWWRQTVGSGRPTDLASGQRVLREALEQFERVMPPHHLSAMVCQGLYDQVRAAAERAGRPGLETSVITGQGGMAETEMVADLWDVSRGRLGVEEFLARHGYHSPGAGEVNAVPWRVDPAPLHRILASYRDMPEDRDPRRLEEERTTLRRDAEADLLAATSRARRPGVRGLLAVTARLFPLRGVGKAGFLRCVDVVRAAAAAAGSELAASGAIGAPEDAVMLTVPELLGASNTDDFTGIIAQRREIDNAYRAVRLPEVWVGMPEPAEPETPGAGVVAGTAVSPGVVTGTARLVLDPGDLLEPGEILVCHTTDPGWAAVMMLSSALVIDVGGPISHGAIVARELGIPCVIGTRDGTARIRTGDRIRVDGSSGEVTVLGSG